MKYTIYFSIGNKNLKHTLEAYSREDAIQRLKAKINVHRVDQELDDEPEIMRFMRGFNIKGK
jgi:hypothetical protein